MVDVAAQLGKFILDLHLLVPLFEGVGQCLFVLGQAVSLFILCLESACFHYHIDQPIQCVAGRDEFVRKYCKCNSAVLVLPNYFDIFCRIP